ncbi:hypothetical protein CHS0354_020094, partial [Potamilus streckersoni]
MFNINSIISKERNWTCKGEEQFKCRFSFCIKRSQVCDGLIDCNMTYWDEYHCSKYVVNKKQKSFNKNYQRNVDANPPVTILLKQFSCPTPDLTCDCEEHSMDCSHRNLTSLPNNLDIDNGATKFIMRGNRIVIKPDMFIKLDRLTYLDLSENGIEHLPARLFRSLWRLITLYLKGNIISIIQPYAFVGLSHLLTLDISCQRLSKIETNTFLGLKSTRKVNISGNVVTDVADGCFNGLSAIQTLDISNNRIRFIGENVFNGLKKLNFLYTDEYQFCCMAKISRQCFPE